MDVQVSPRVDQQLRSRIRALVYAHTEAFCTLLDIDIDSDVHTRIDESQAATSATETTMQDLASEEYERPADDSATTTAVANKEQTAEEKPVPRDHHRSASESDSESEQK